MNADNDRNRESHDAQVSARDRSLTRRSRAAGVGIVLVLLAVSVFGVWSASTTASAADQVSRDIRIASLYSDAAKAAEREEPIELEYRLNPSPEGLTRHESATAELVSALAEIRREGDDGDRLLADQVREQLVAYLIAAHRLFDAVDRGNLVEAVHLDATGTDIALDDMQELVVTAADQKRQTALTELNHLHDLESLDRVLTPIVFLAGLLLTAVLTLITRGHRRLLDSERARALHESQHDPLTGLPNRALLSDFLTAAVQEPRDDASGMAVLIVNLDRFQAINDTFGYDRGDELLIQVAERLTALVPDRAVVGHLGGDKFAVLLPRAADLGEATRIVADFHDSLHRPFQVDGIALEIEARVGIAVAGQHGNDAPTLLRHADIALQVATSGALDAAVYDPVTDDHTPAKVALLGDLRRGIDRRELLLHYQPKVSIRSGDLVGAEALLRWTHPEQGPIRPDTFIPVAEHSGLIGPLTEYVLEVALEQSHTWREADHPVVIAVNLSARNLLDPSIPVQVSNLLLRHGIPPELLVLEVTESAIMLDPAKSRRLLNELAALGLCIAIDDFGTGYTSLGQLRYLPVHELKIDQSFVKTMTRDAENAHIVRNIINLGHDLGLTLVAEGVEDEATLNLLRDYGCDIAQGYHLARPMPPETFADWQRTHGTAAGFLGARASATSTAVLK